MKAAKGKARKLYRVFILVVLLIMGMAVHVQAGTKSVTLTEGQKTAFGYEKLEESQMEE